MGIAAKLRERKSEIESILETFGTESHERVEDILEEREDIIVTLRTLSRYPEEQELGLCPLCSSKAHVGFTPYCSADCQTHDNLLG